MTHTDRLAISLLVFGAIWTGDAGAQDVGRHRMLIMVEGQRVVMYGTRAELEAVRAKEHAKRAATRVRRLAEQRAIFKAIVASVRGKR